MSKICPKRLEDWLHEQLRDPIFAGQYLTAAVTARYDLPDRDRQGFLADALIAIAAANEADIALRDAIAARRSAPLVSLSTCGRPAET